MEKAEAREKERLKVEERKVKIREVSHPTRHDAFSHFLMMSCSGCGCHAVGVVEHKLLKTVVNVHF